MTRLSHAFRDKVLNWDTINNHIPLVQFSSMQQLEFDNIHIPVQEHIQCFIVFRWFTAEMRQLKLHGFS